MKDALVKHLILLGKKDANLTNIFIPSGQARRLYLNEARKILDEIGVSNYNYSNPSGTNNSISLNGV